VKKILLASAAALPLLLGACVPGVTSSDSTKIEAVLTQLGNTLVTDLQQQAATALAATPPDTDGAQCAGTLPNPAVAGDLGTGALAVAAAIQRVNAVNGGKAIGTLTLAEIATLYQPGSAQFNWAVKVLETACIAKVHDVNQAINSTAGIIGALPSVLALAAAPAGM
jgi:hypothetical protein